MVLARFLVALTVLTFSSVTRGQIYNPYTTENTTGITLRVGSILSAPFLQPRGEDVESQGYEGFIIDMMNSLAAREGFRYQIKISSDNLYGVPTEDGTWTGLIGMLLRNEIDVIAADLTVSEVRSEAIDFTSPFLSSYLTILIKKPEVEWTMSVSVWFEPFNLLIWLLLLLSFILTNIILWVIFRLSLDEECPYPSFLDCCWLTVLPWAITKIDARCKSVAVRMVLTTWYIFSFLFLAVYLLTLPSYLFPATVEPAIPTSVEEAITSDLKFGVVQGGSSRLLLERSSNPIHRKIWSRISESPTDYLVHNYESGLARVKSEAGQFGMIMESTAARYLTSFDCSLATLGRLEDRYYSLGMRKDFRMRGWLSQGVLRLAESGRISELERIWWPAGDCAGEDRAHVTGAGYVVSPLGLTETSFLFAVLAVVLLLAVVFAGCELLIRLSRAGKTSSLGSYLANAFSSPPDSSLEKPKKNPSVATQTVLWSTSRQQTPTASPRILSQRIYYEGR